MKVQLLIDGDSEDRDIKGLIAYLNGNSALPEAAAGAAKAPVKDIKTATKEPAKTESLTLEELRGMFMAVAKSGKAQKTACGALLEKFETTGISDLPTDRYAEFVIELKKIK